MDFSYNLPLLLGKHVKVLKVPWHLLEESRRNNRGLTRPAWWSLNQGKWVNPIGIWDCEAWW
ncbi:unnamed protein product, partial [Prunus brigantina]